MIDSLYNSTLLVSHDRTFFVWTMNRDSLQLVNTFPYHFPYCHKDFIILKEPLHVYKFNETTGEITFFSTLTYHSGKLVYDDIYIISGSNLLVVSVKNTIKFVIFDLETGHELPVSCPIDVSVIFVIKKFEDNLYFLVTSFNSIKIIEYDTKKKLWIKEINCMEDITMTSLIGLNFWVNKNVVVFKGMAVLDQNTGLPCKIVQIGDRTEFKFFKQLQPLPPGYMFKCFLVDDTVILASAEDEIMIYSSLEVVYLNIEKEYVDINLIPNSILVMSYKKSFQVYDVSKRIKLYEVLLKFEALKRPLFNLQFFVVRGVDSKVGVYNFKGNLFEKDNYLSSVD